MKKKTLISIFAVLLLLSGTLFGCSNSESIGSTDKTNETESKDEIDEQNMQLLKTEAYDMETGELYYTSTYEYDENGNLIHYLRVYEDDDTSSWDEYRTYEENDEARITKKNIKTSDGEEHKIEYVYKNKKSYKECDFNPETFEETSCGLFEYEYDNEDRLSKITATYDDSVTISSYVYDKDKEIITSETISNGAVIETAIEEYTLVANCYYRTTYKIYDSNNKLTFSSENKVAYDETNDIIYNQILEDGGIVNTIKEKYVNGVAVYSESTGNRPLARYFKECSTYKVGDEIITYDNFDF